MKFDRMVDILLEQLKIVAPAVKLPSGKVVPGKPGEMHAHVYDRIARRIAQLNNVSLQAAEKRINKLTDQGKFVSGFVDNEGNWHTREEAWNIAKGYDKNIEDQDKDLDQREDGDVHKRLSSEWIPGTRTHPAYL